MIMLIGVFLALFTSNFLFFTFPIIDAKVHQKNGKSKNNYLFFLKSHIF